jgi:hypothetical protein
MSEQGTELYRRTIAYDLGDPERNELMAQVWSGTPWMVDAYTGSHDDPRQYEIIAWCREMFGPEAWPIHGKPGQWHRGGATIDGWNWIGFATESQMQQFLERWPAPEGVEHA